MKVLLIVMMALSLKEEVVVVFLPGYWWHPGGEAGVAWGQEGQFERWRSGQLSYCPLPQWPP